MEPPTPYSQVVDNATPGRFYSVRPWKKSDGRSTRYGKDFRHTRPGKGANPAWFKVRIPTSGHYTVYARWPATDGNNPATRFRVHTASGLRNVQVNQRRDGGTWVRLGAYRMEESDRYSVQVSGRSKAEGRIVADAVMVVAGTQASPNEVDGPSVGGRPSPTVGGEVVDSEVIERARTHLGTPYRHSPPLPCQAYRSEDCSCFTSLVFSKWVSMPDDPISQWKFGHYVEQSDLRPGDLLFFKEAGPSHPITHVGIYSGDGNMLHGSSYYGRVVESPMRYVDGYYGAKRLTNSTTPSAEGPARTMVASYYGRALEGHKMANGQPFDADAYTAAHKTLPFGTELEVSYGGKSVRVTVTDRGPYAAGRDLDLSLAAARKLGMLSRGVAPVRVRIV
jgi:cell wall-associated NlpC family hydrolase